ncbi:MAG: MFS transporter [Pseudomonadota bacterium]
MLAQVSVSSLQQGLPATGPLMPEAFDLPLPGLGALLACASWGTMLTVNLWGRLADFWGERTVVAAGLTGATVTFVAISWVETPVGLGCALAIAGAISGSAIAATGRAVMGWFSRDERGFALGPRQMVVPLGACFAALALPVAALQFGLNGTFLVLAALAGAGAVVAVLALGPRRTAKAGNAAPRSPVRDPAIWKLSSAHGLMQWAQVAMNTFFVVTLVEHQSVGFALAVGLLAFVQAASGLARVLAGWHGTDMAGAYRIWWCWAVFWWLCCWWPVCCKPCSRRCRWSR